MEFVEPSSVSGGDQCGASEYGLELVKVGFVLPREGGDSSLRWRRARERRRLRGVTIDNLDV